MIGFDYETFLNQKITKYINFQKETFFRKADLILLKVKPVESYTEDKESIYKILKDFLGENISSITLCERSTLHKVYKITAVKKQYILKINLFNRIYSEFNFIVDDWILKQLSKRKIFTLKVYKVDLSRINTPFDYQIMDAAKGVSLYDLSIKRDLDNVLLYKLGILIGKIHNTRTGKFGYFNIKKIFKNKGIGVYNKWSEYLLQNLKPHLKYCLKNKIIDKKLHNEILKIFNIKRVPVVKQPVLLHGDLANHNVFTDGKNITAVIDWEDSISGDPIFDIAYYGTGAFANQNWYLSFLAGYKSINKLPEDFYYRYWIYFLRISIAKAVIRFDSDKDKYQPMVSDRIKEGVIRLSFLS